MVLVAAICHLLLFQATLLVVVLYIYRCRRETHSCRIEIALEIHWKTMDQIHNFRGETVYYFN